MSNESDQIQHKAKESDENVMDMTSLPDNFGVNLNNKNPVPSKFYNIPIELTVELGRTSKTVSELGLLSVGSVIELEQKANDPIIISCQGSPLASAKVVNINGQLHLEIINIEP